MELSGLRGDEQGRAEQGALNQAVWFSKVPNFPSNPVCLTLNALISRMPQLTELR
jgi:hypothetical protein